MSIKTLDDMIKKCKKQIEIETDPQKRLRFEDMLQQAMKAPQKTGVATTTTSTESTMGQVPITVQLIKSERRSDELAIVQPAPLDNLSVSKKTKKNTSSTRKRCSSTISSSRKRKDSKHSKHSKHTKNIKSIKSHKPYKSTKQIEKMKSVTTTPGVKNASLVNTSLNISLLTSTTTTADNELQSQKWNINYKSKENAVYAHDKYFDKNRYNGYGYNNNNKSDTFVEYPWQYSTKMENSTHVRDYLNPCLKLLNKLLTMDESLWFIDPIEIHINSIVNKNNNYIDNLYGLKNEDIQRYQQLVSQPQCLNGVLKLLKSDYYETVDDFANHVRLIWQNTYRWWKGYEKHENGKIWIKNAKKLEKVFETKLSKISRKIPNRERIFCKNGNPESHPLQKEVSLSKSLSASLEPLERLEPFP